MNIRQSAAARRRRRRSVALVQAVEARRLLSVSLAVDADATPISTSTPGNFADANGTLLFTHNDGKHGVELFSSDGTTAGTKLLVDIRPGLTGSSPTGLTSVNGIVYFAANDGVHGTELWRSDGTAAGTRMVSDALAGTGGSLPYGFTAMPDGSVLYFASTNNGSTNGWGVWRTDGTAAGTYQLKSTYDSYGYQGTGSPVIMNGLAYFIVGGVSSGGELWRSDGTAAGTVKVQTFAGDYPVKDLLVIGGDHLFFSGGYKKAYVSDGSVNGAQLLATIGTGGTFSGGVNTGGIANAVAVGDKAFFTVNDGTSGIELWAADATHAYRVKDIIPGTIGSIPSQLTAYNGQVYFATNDSSVGGELWTSDGTDAGTVPVRDLRGGILSSRIANLRAAGGRLWFGAVGDAGAGVYSSDGTDAGTGLVAAISGSNIVGNQPGNFLAVGGNVFFSAGDTTAGIELWMSSASAPSAANTQRLGDLFPATGTALPRVIGTINDRVVYFADDEVHGWEPWSTDGTPAGSGMLKDIYVGSTGSTPRFGDPTGAATSQYLYFAGQSGSSTYGIYRTDGTPGGTLLLKTFSSQLGGFSVWKDKVYIGTPSGLYTSDGTVAGTVPATGAVAPTNVVLGGVFYRATYDATYGTELWRSDGTSAGTYRVTDINPGAGSSSPIGITAVGSDIFFFATATNASNGAMLYKYTPATNTTTLVKDVIAGRDDFQYGSTAAVNGKFLFTTNDYIVGEELYVSDGTAAGTGLLKDIVAGTNNGSSPQQLTSLGNVVVFRAGVYGSEHLWRTDGTAAGTYEISTVNPEYSSTIGVSNIKPFNGELYFNGYANGFEGIWRTDGTTAGTRLVASVDPGGQNYSVQISPVSNRLFFTADDYIKGQEMWSYVPDAPPLVVQSATFEAEGPGAGRIRLHLNRPGSLDLLRGTLTLIDRATNTAPTAASLSLSLDEASGDVLVQLTNPGVVLPDGNYRLTLPAGAFTDAALNPLADNTSTDFFILGGDLNHDRSVDFSDLLILAKNYGQSGRTFSQGNVDYSADGKVDFNDLLLLAKRYGTTLTAPATQSAPVLAPAETATGRRRKTTASPVDFD